MDGGEHVMIWAGRFKSWYSRVGIRAGRFVCSVLTLERCCERRGSEMVDHVYWTTGGEVRRVELRAGRFVEAGPRVGRFVWASHIPSPWSIICVNWRLKSLGVLRSWPRTKLNKIVGCILILLTY